MYTHKINIFLIFILGYIVRSIRSGGMDLMAQLIARGFGERGICEVRVG